MPLTKRSLEDRARKIKLLLLDVDGVLTDGRMYYLPRPNGGVFETKGFHSLDGYGIRLAHEAGLRTGLITGRNSLAVEQRAKELKIEFVRQDALEKLDPYKKILRAANLDDEAVCYVGDDVVDLPILTRVGLAVGVSSGHLLLRRYVHYWTRRPGGFGAVREVIELILTAQGKWSGILKKYLK